MGCIDDGQFGKHLFDDIQSGRGVMGWMFGVRYIAWRIMGRMVNDGPLGDRRSGGRNFGGRVVGRMVRGIR